MSWRMQQALEDAALPEHLRAVENWPPAMREQWSNDRGQAHSDKHRQDMIDQFRKIRAELDAFKPDFVLIWGDDQYENFREDCVPAFSVLAYDSVDIQPWKGSTGFVSPARCTRWVASNPTNQCFSNRGSPILTRCSLYFGPSRKYALAAL